MKYVLFRSFGSIDKDIVIENISAAYRENAPEYIYFVALYNIFKEFLDDVSEDELPNEATGTGFIHFTWSISVKKAKSSAITSIRKNCSTPCVCSVVARASRAWSFASGSMTKPMMGAKWAKSLSC